LDEFHWLVCGVDWQQLKGHDLAKWIYPEDPTEVQGNAITQ
ncbi:IS66 family insertion sequence element accessory protein TnpB, partial [Escherichia coli]|nr:IS66 family insertion sequence element accessory protein TnpB [Escherichia coli]